MTVRSNCLLSLQPRAGLLFAELAPLPLYEDQVEAGSYDAPQVTAEDGDPPPARSGREGGAAPAKTEDHQPRPQVSGGVDGVAEGLIVSKFEVVKPQKKGPDQGIVRT